VAGYFGGRVGQAQEQREVVIARNDYLERRGGTDGLQAALGVPPWNDMKRTYYDRLMTARTGATLASAIDTLEQTIASIQRFADAGETRTPLGSVNGEYFYAPRPFHAGGMVPGQGEIPATLLGGEGVLSHRGMAALGALNEGRANTGSADLRSELSGIRRELQNVFREQRRVMKIALEEAVALAGRR
jgi:hypothetical protein